MDQNIQAEDILNAYINKFGHHPQKIEHLITFTKQSKELTDLKYSEARKIMRYSQSKQPLISSTCSKSTKSVSIEPNTSSKSVRKSKKTRSKSSNKNRSKSATKTSSKKPCKLMTNGISNGISNDNQLIAISTTELTPNIDIVASSDDLNKYIIGDHVKLTQDRDGIIRYIGDVLFSSDTMFGIELLNGAVGKHDGKVGNKRYFHAPKHRGIFVKQCRIQRKIRRRDRKSSLQLNREAALKKKKKWIPPYDTTKQFKSERSYIHQQNNNNDEIDDSSMSIIYRKASLNLHRHILQKVNDIKQGKNINAFSSHSKLHSPMIPIRVTPILTFANVPVQTMQSITHKMMKRRKKRRSLIIHKRPSIPSIPSPIIANNNNNNNNNNNKPFSFSVEDEIKYDNNNNIIKQKQKGVKSPIGFSPKHEYMMNTPSTPAMISIPPLSQVTIDYVEMEEKVNHLIEILINKKERISSISEIDSIYNQCEITKNDLNEGLFGWIDLLCTHSKLFNKTLLIKPITKTNCFFSPKEGDDNINNINNINNNNYSDDNDISNISTPTKRDKEKEILRKKHNLKYGNNWSYYFDLDRDRIYYYTVFERLLFELDFYFLYFIYDIGMDNSNAFSELHPSSLFLLSGNITQILKKCSPILNNDIYIFYDKMLYPHHLKIRYKYLNNNNKWNIISMTKYATDGILNDYNFVGRIQYEEMFHIDTDNDDIKDIDIDNIDNIDIERYSNNLEYELIVYTNMNRAGIVIYKSIIPSIFSITTDIKLINLKRTIMIPSLILSSKCYIQCEKWNDDGDYYGFIRIKIRNNLIINKESIISASECGYYKQNGFGVGSFKNDFKNKIKYYSGGGYGTNSESPNIECPSGKSYGNDCIENNYLYYGSPSFDDNERGGGIIDILCYKIFINFGNIQCNGSNGMQFGGSSGGSIKIVANLFINFGNITADGGKGAIYQRKGSKRKQFGTKGGDGRIFIICNKFINKGNISPKPIIISIKKYNKYKEFSHIKSLNQNITF